ncbi:hypothetical protein ACQKFG_24145 [Peribacillus sp. NPDC076916]|uniref:hypothetical protein n=1 Tax=Peribacillus sp. NPDC076916 TaxID=3390608 RepID=UPI003D020F0B
MPGQPSYVNPQNCCDWWWLDHFPNARFAMHAPSKTAKLTSKSVEFTSKTAKLTSKSADFTSKSVKLTSISAKLKANDC